MEGKSVCYGLVALLEARCHHVVLITVVKSFISLADFLCSCVEKRRGNTHRLNIGEAMFGQLVPAGEKVVPQLELLGQGAPGGISFPNVFAAVLSLQDLERKLK